MSDTYPPGEVIEPLKEPKSKPPASDVNRRIRNVSVSILGVVLLVAVGLVEVLVVVVWLLVGLAFSCNAEAYGPNPPCEHILTEPGAFFLYAVAVIAMLPLLWGILRPRQRFWRAIALNLTIVGVVWCYLQVFG